MWFRILLLAFALPAFAETALQLTNVRHREYEDGPVINQPQYLPGNLVFLDFQISGFKIVEKALIKSMDIGWTYRVLDPAGVPLIPAKSGETSHELQPEDKEWMPKVRLEFPIPDSAPSGTYHVVVDLEDRKDGSKGQRKIPFQVAGRDVDPAQQVNIFNLRFFRGEDDPDPISTPAFRPGDPIFTRFDINGYQLGPKNAVQVSFDITVREAVGKETPDKEVKPPRVVMSANDAFQLGAAEHFYPPRFLSGAVSFKLESGNAKGPYLLILQAKDKIAGKQAEFTFPFTLE